MNQRTNCSNPAAAVLLFGAVATLAACDALSVQNPAAINEEDLTDPNLITAMANSVVSEFQGMYSQLAYTLAVFTDEVVTGETATTWMELDLRIISPTTTAVSSNVYVPLQRARHAGDDMAARLKKLVENPSADLRVATALAYGGYSYVLLGEYMCHAPIKVGEDALSSDQLLAIAIQRLDEAMNVAMAAKSQGANASQADRLAFLARVGAARAALQMGNNSLAVSYASGVPGDFVYWVRHLSEPTSVRNVFAARTTGSSQTLGVDVAFRGLNDRRVRHAANPRTGGNQKTLLWTPFQPPSFSGWTEAGGDMAFQHDTDIRMSSGLEARYILAEAGGMTGVQLLSFINERRAVGGQGSFAGTDLMAELRDQRRRDFFLDGHRLGDLRRYKRFHNLDLFPKGPHPNADDWGWGNYSDAECFVPSRGEIIGNPGYNG